MAIDKNSKAYQSLLKSGYSDDQISQMSSSVASGQSAKDVVANANSVNTTTATTTPTKTTTTPTQVTTSTPVVKPEYQGTGGSSVRPKDTSWDKGDGQYAYNPTSGYYEKVGESGTKTQTSTTPTQTTTPANDNVSKIADGWNNMSYQQQQAALQKNPSLQQVLDKYGIGSKSAPEQNVTNQGQTTPKQDEWDYQDNSPERMLQMADNVERLYQTDPGLFTNEQTFRNFFINGKGRTPEQEAFLMDYYKNRQTYNKYDGISAENAGNLLANGQLPQNYLNYVKNSNPDRYNAIMDAKDKAEDQIRADTALDTINSMTGDDTATITSKAIEWLKTQGLFVDKDGNLIDDRTENYASDEEKQYAKDAADIIARNLDIDNTVKHTYDDLVKAYPGATKATLMAMAQDMNADLLREKENNNVELTRLEGYINYMQSERQERNRIGESSMRQLQEMYGMYYDYSPEGMSELVQNKYAATNITLDQADNGTDTQKQIALDSVLTDYFDKYGSIIQRSKSQVINDVMAYAKKNGVSLSQALEENFLKPLRAKPGFAQLNTIPSTNPEIVKIGDNAYAYWDDNGNLVSVGGTLGANGVYQFSDAELRTVGNDGKFTDTVGNDINSIGHILNSEDGLRIGTYTNPKGYTYNVYATREDGIQATENLLKRAYYGMTLGDAAQKWIGQGKNISDAKKVIQSKGLSLNDKLSDANVRKFIEAIGTREGTLKGQSLDEWAKGGKILGTPKGTEGGQKRNPELETFLDKWKGTEGDRLKEKDFWATYGKELEAKGVSKEDFLKQFKEYYAYNARDAYLEILSNLDHLIELTGKEFDWRERTSALSGLGDAGKVFKYIKNNLTVNGLQEARDRGLKLGVLSDSDVKMIAEAASVLDWDVSQGTWNRALQDFRQSLLNNNPYLKKQYKYQSAYSPSVGFKYNDNDKSFTFGTRKDQSGTQGAAQGTTQGTTTQAKSIKNLTKVNR